MKCGVCGRASHAYKLRDLSGFPVITLDRLSLTLLAENVPVGLLSLLQYGLSYAIFIVILLRSIRS
jgi:hypothetical protein